MGKSRTQAILSSWGSYKFNSRPNRSRKAFNAAELTLNVSATQKSRSPGSACSLAMIAFWWSALKNFAIGESSSPSFTRKNAKPLAPYCFTNSVNSSICFRLYFSAALGTRIPRTRPPAAIVDLNTPKSHALAISARSVNSRPNRISGLSLPNRSMTSRWVSLGSGNFNSVPRSVLTSRAIKPSIV